MSQSLKAALTKVPQTQWLKQQTFLSHGSGGWKSKLEVRADSVSAEVLLPGSYTATFSPCPHRVEGTREVSGIYFSMAEIPLMRAAPL